MFAIYVTVVFIFDPKHISFKVILLRERGVKGCTVYSHYYLWNAVQKHTQRSHIIVVYSNFNIAFFKTKQKLICGGID